LYQVDMLAVAGEERTRSPSSGRPEHSRGHHIVTEILDRESTSTSTSVGSGGTQPVFRSSETLADNLQKVHVDLIELHLQGKQAHWNVVGRNFRDTHLILDEIIEAARTFSDEVAERMRALYITPDGRSRTVSANTSLPEFPEGEIDTTETIDLVAERLYATVGTMRGVHDAIDEEDPSTADLLHAMIIRLEQFAWMVSAENRVANKSEPKPIHE
jgi:starvation-inducible DNA-binding protein